MSPEDKEKMVKENPEAFAKLTVGYPHNRGRLVRGLRDVCRLQMEMIGDNSIGVILRNSFMRLSSA